MNGELMFLNLIQKIRFPLLDTIMVFITHLGDKGVIWIGLTTILIIYRKTRTLGLVMLLSIIIDLILCNGLLKPLIARPRPFVFNPHINLLIAKPNDYSFPSGHTAISFAVAGICYLLIQKRLFTSTLILALLMGISRMYLYVHYPSDILGGMLVGCLSSWLAYRFYNQIQKYSQTQKKKIPMH